MSNDNVPKLTVQCVKMILRKDDLDQMAKEVLGDTSKMYLYAFDSFPLDVNLYEVMDSLKIIEANNETDFLRKLIKLDGDFLEMVAWSRGDDFVNQEVYDMYMNLIKQESEVEKLVDSASKCIDRNLFYTTIQALKTKTDAELQ
uniref:Uncharacterized protein n=1 Tax=Clandestinovirus TaxID=2831644 RepID=A0A8F8KPC1_9VIRU|nr:hypothetical protein KOM_12_55 [Clandestinovirus]